MLSLFLTIFGIGFLLFIHEGGHFLAARAAGVRVDVFSLGFGPRLWGFKRGDTDYRLCAIPLGGYVKMAGEDGNGLGSDALNRKSPAWRFLIYSGGILMNFLFALIVIPILFRVGVPLQSPVLGPVQAGSAAWEAGLQEGDRVLSIDERKLHSFSDLASSVALSAENTPLIFQVQSADGTRREVSAMPHYDEARGFPSLGVGPAFDLVVNPEYSGAQLWAKDETPWGLNGVFFQNTLEMRVLLQEALLHQKPFELSVGPSADDTRVVTVTPTPLPDTQQFRLGVFHMRHEVVQARGPVADLLEPGDLLLSVNARSVRDLDDFLVACLQASPDATLTFRRDGKSMTVALPALSSLQWASALQLKSPSGAPSIQVLPGHAADRAGLQTRDRVQWLGVQTPSISLGGTITRFEEMPEILAAFQKSVESGALPADAELRCLAGHQGNVQEYFLKPEATARHSVPLGFQVHQEIVQEKNLFAAFSTGLSQARSMVQDAALSMKRLVTGRISATNMGGMITIGRATHSFAQNGLMSLLFFLSLISIHLAVLNLMPIPALDGGHLFFLLFEIIFRRPVSERIQVGFQTMGFFLLLGLLFFVTFLDIQRLFS